jgi:hypothetical protein
VNYPQNRQGSGLTSTHAARRPPQTSASARIETASKAPRLDYDASWIRSSLSQGSAMARARTPGRSWIGMAHERFAEDGFGGLKKLPGGRNAGGAGDRPAPQEGGLDPHAI